jgi:hypothetical protein
VQVVQAADEQQVGDLLDHLQRVGDAAGPEGIPDLVDLVLDVAGDHAGFLGLVGFIAVGSIRCSGIFAVPGSSRQAR